MKRLVLLAVLLALAGAVRAQSTNDPREVPGNKQSDWEIDQQKRNAQESAASLPALPRSADLIEFWVSNSTAFRFFIDLASISVSEDHIIRYTFVARSPSGVANISYEGMRCKEGLFKVYAYAQDGKWVPRNNEWQIIEPNAIARWHNELRFRYFCASRRGALLSKEEGIDALRRGGHPGAAARPGY